MYTEQIQQYHAKLTQQRIDGKIQNNELVWCKGIATLRAFIDNKCHSVSMRTDMDNASAINKLTKIIDKSVKNAKANKSQTENTNSTTEED